MNNANKRALDDLAKQTLRSAIGSMNTARIGEHSICCIRHDALRSGNMAATLRWKANGSKERRDEVYKLCNAVPAQRGSIRRYHPITPERLRACLSAGMSTRRISEQLSVSLHAVREACSLFGWSAHGQAGPMPNKVELAEVPRPAPQTGIRTVWRSIPHHAQGMNDDMATDRDCAAR